MGAGMSSTIDYHYQTVGRILVFLIEKGLARVDLEAQDAMDVMRETRGDEEEVLQAFADCLQWMIAEGLIRAHSVQEYDGGYSFNGVQLTSAGIAMIKRKTDDAEIGPSIEARVKKQDKEPLDVSAYTKMGEFVGSALGGLTKSLGGG